MEDAFGYVLFGVVAIGSVLAFLMFVGVGRVYDQIGKGGLSLRDGSDRPDHEPRAGGAAAAAEQEAEIRQMLEARNERRARRGEAPLDIEDELARLLQPVVDPALALEVRQHVEARNERRLRMGKPPLDIEAEIERQLRDLT
jgi:hypothetical protein